jgi:hypothetical protein
MVKGMKARLALTKVLYADGSQHLASIREENLHPVKMSNFAIIEGFMQAPRIRLSHRAATGLH